jgi:hypothetical protein
MTIIYCSKKIISKFASASALTVTSLSILLSLASHTFAIPTDNTPLFRDKKSLEAEGYVCVPGPLASWKCTKPGSPDYSCDAVCIPEKQKKPVIRQIPGIPRVTDTLISPQLLFPSASLAAEKKVHPLASRDTVKNNCNKQGGRYLEDKDIYGCVLSSGTRVACSERDNECISWKPKQQTPSRREQIQNLELQLLPLTTR